MKGSRLIKVGGPDYRKSDECEICKRSFKKVRFGHHFRTRFGEIDVCLACAENLYETVFTDVACATLSLRRDVDRLQELFILLEKSKKWRSILKEVNASQKK